MFNYNSVTPGDDAGYVDELCDRVEAALDEGLVPVDVLCDERVFRAEMERIFTSTWVFVAHESEIPKKNDFVLRRIGLDGVIVARSADNQINVMLNHCRHRGSELCHEDSGNASHFKCPYHGWIYKNDGDWASAPHLADAYGERLDPQAWGLLKANKVEVFHGFIFAALSDDVPPLREYLGGAAWALDAIMGLHPDGVRAVAPPERFRVRADWKSGAENFCGDAYHVSTAHLSTQLANFIPGINQVSSIACGYQFENGHSFIGHALPKLIGPPFAIWGYPQEVKDKFDLSKLDDVQLDMITNNPPTIGTIFPNFSYLRFPQPADVGEMPSVFTNIRMWQPIAPGVMEIWNWEFDYVCVPKEMAEKSYLAGQFGFGAGGIFEQDDTAVWEGIAKAANSPWARSKDMKLHYKQKSCEPDPDWKGPGTLYPSIYGENLQKEFWRRWLKDMRAGATKPNRIPLTEIGSCKH